MEKVLGRFGNLFYAALRIVTGFLFACHGAQKVLGLLGGTPGTGGPAEMFSLFWIAGLIELVGGVLGTIDCPVISQSGSWRLPRRCRPRFRPVMIENL